MEKNLNRILSDQKSKTKLSLLICVSLAVASAFLLPTGQLIGWAFLVMAVITGATLAIRIRRGKSAILMAEYSKQERDAGVDITEAALNGMRLRFRSVMMTALSFVIGVFPMVVATGAGAGSRRSIGVTTFWGMLVASVLA